MKIVKCFLLLAALVLCRESFAQTERNGNWWSQNNQLAKVTYVLGFWDGEAEESLNYAGSLFGGLPAKPLTKEAGDALTQYMAALMKGARERSESCQSMTAGQIVEGIDTYYHDYRNRLIPVPQIIRVVRFSVAGKSAIDIEQILVSLRKNASGGGAK